ncbi:hypothetical protein LPB140_05595 [Sphingorhabdus lutea]|uniref:Glycoside hydrolase family 25 n=1 Tax=Sphingorhabdus lutea TaxID=1913578 RepID=A0A1L3JB39_9SPHN|nr:GH25 family lysozyme [Sphingorhabdus lutea]APG62355.1 hypothetical protein LPB140_05595 [Sphingorhabdus lutea]
MTGKKIIKYTVFIVLFCAIIFYGSKFAISSWTPDKITYPVQGIAISEINGTPNWPEVATQNVDFAYISASWGSDHKDKSFDYNLKGVKSSGIRYGVVHHFDLCHLASDQATMFITTVPRDEHALPPAIFLDFDEKCSSRPDRSLLLSEISTFLGQVETHLDRSALLYISKDFENEYQISQSVNRDLWVDSFWFLPNYTPKSWTLWTANAYAEVDGIDEPVKWTLLK